MGSSATPVYVPAISALSKSDEAELRIDAADAIRMIGTTESALAQLIPLANDPVPDVRKAASQLLRRGKEETPALLARRTAASERTGPTPDSTPDPKQYGMPLAPDSVYLFFASNVSQERLAYETRRPMKDTQAFSPQKTKMGPLQLEAFIRRTDVRSMTSSKPASKPNKRPRPTCSPKSCPPPPPKWKPT